MRPDSAPFTLPAENPCDITLGGPRGREETNMLLGGEMNTGS